VLTGHHTEQRPKIVFAMGVTGNLSLSISRASTPGVLVLAVTGPLVI